MFTTPSRRYAVGSLPPDFTPQKPDLTSQQKKYVSASVTRFIVRLILFTVSVGVFLLLTTALAADAAGPEEDRKQITQHIPDDTSDEDVLAVLVKHVLDQSPLADKLDIV